MRDRIVKLSALKKTSLPLQIVPGTVPIIGVSEWQRALSIWQLTSWQHRYIVRGRTADKSKVCGKLSAEFHYSRTCCRANSSWEKQTMCRQCIFGFRVFDTSFKNELTARLRVWGVRIGREPLAVFPLQGHILLLQVPPEAGLEETPHELPAEDREELRAHRSKRERHQCDNSRGQFGEWDSQCGRWESLPQLGLVSFR